MSEPATRRMSADAFLDWCLARQERYELIDGEPRAMTGATRRHDQIVVNALGTMFGLLRGHRCRPFTADNAVRIPAGNVRRPDAGIDCGTFNDADTWVDSPYLVIEVLSPSTRAFDMLDKLEEYKSVPGLSHILMIDPDIPEARHWSHGSDGGWSFRHLEGLAALVRLPELPAEITLGALYEGLTFRPRPRLVPDN